jgi:transposase
LYQYVERTFPDHAVDLVYEAGLWFSSARYFFKLGWNVLVVNPSDVRGDKERYQKTDALDSKKLVQLKSGVLRVFFSHRRARTI